MNNYGEGISFLGALFVGFFILKITGEITWSWWWVFAPLWAPLAVALAILIIVAIVGVVKDGL